MTITSTGPPKGAEKIVRLPEGHPAPDGWRIARILETHQVPTGMGTNWKYVYTVVLKKVKA